MILKTEAGRRRVSLLFCNHSHRFTVIMRGKENFREHL